MLGEKAILREYESLKKKEERNRLLMYSSDRNQIFGSIGDTNQNS